FGVHEILPVNSVRLSRCLAASMGHRVSALVRGGHHDRERDVSGAPQPPAVMRSPGGASGGRGTGTPGPPP
ncbi:MAG: hypothetical protein LC776_12660, partial [Acidobacteria bacterium]|nr:hypothetical protein [Acidobacteriota bacterium]